MNTNGQKEITADDMRNILRQRYKGNGWLLYEEVKRSTGYRKPERYADALVIQLFPSKLINITGIEIKTSRNDLLNELRDLTKSEAIKQFCDYWVLFISDESILKGKITIPDDWGIWIASQFGGFRTYKKPMQLYPKPVDRYFLASLLRHTNTARAE